MNRREVLRGAAMVGAATLTRRSRGLLAQVNPTIAATMHGKVRGYVADGEVVAFKGVPYGRDTRLTRFAAPLPPVAWTDVRECTEWAARAPQVVGARPTSQKRDVGHPEPGYHLPPDEGVESEDCLHLNVWTPGLRSRRRRPVMVYIHGGAFANGTANAALYDGTRLTRRGDVVVVTVNHRLNSFGYAYFVELLPGLGFEDSGNAGQLDLVLALRWVRENIAEFGGDPNCVMIFGQSGGGAKCATLMAQPPAKGLFHRVLSMSGQQVAGVQRRHATERAAVVLKNLGLDAAQPTAAAKGLRAATMEQIQAATKSAGYFGPVKDGRSLPVDPFSPTDPVQSAEIPMMLGNTHDETRLLIGGGHPEYFQLTWETLPAALERDAPFLRSESVTLPAAEAIAKYRAWHPAYTASDVFFAITTDSRSWRGEVIEAEARARDPKAQPHTWVYELDWKSAVDGGKWGAPHTLDLALAFDNVALAPGMVGATAADQARAQRMAETVSEMFLTFARSGNPNGAAVPHWPVFSLDKRETMVFDERTRVEDDPRGQERVYLGQVPYVQPGS